MDTIEISSNHSNETFMIVCSLGYSSATTQESVTYNSLDGTYTNEE